MHRPHVIFGAISGLTIGIDARAASEEIAGGGRVVRELLRALAAATTATGSTPARAGTEPLDERFTWVLSPRPDPYWNLGAALRASRDCDVFLSTNSYLTAWFTTVPDRARDLRHGRLRRRAAPVAARRRDRARDARARAAPRGAPRSASRRPPPTRSRRRYPWARPKLTAVAARRLAGAAARARRRPARALRARRRHARAAQEPAAARRGLPRRCRRRCGARTPLLVAGRIGWEAGETLDALEAVGARRSSAASPTPAWPRSTRAARCSPTRRWREGFGLPVLEAMQAGAAVLTSNVSSLPEVGGDAVEYADPTDTDSIRAGLERLLDRRGAPRRAARRGPGSGRRRFSWAAHAEDTLRVLELTARRRCSRSARRRDRALDLSRGPAVGQRGGDLRGGRSRPPPCGSDCSVLSSHRGVEHALRPRSGCRRG